MRLVVSGITNGQGTIGKLVTDETLYNATTASMTNLNQILLRINQGQGTIGKLVNDQEFYKNAKLTLQKVDKAADSLEDQGPLSVIGIMANQFGLWSGGMSRAARDSRQSQIFQDLDGGARFVQRVEMQSRHAGAQQFLALPRGVFDAEFGGGLVVGSQFIQFRAQRRRDFRAASLGELDDSRRAQNRDNARHERNRNAKLAGHEIPELEIIGVVEKQLREDEIRARVHLFLQMPPVGVFAFLAGDVAFGKTCDADGKIARLADEFHKLRRELKAAGRRLEFAAAGRVAAQGEDVFAAESRGFFRAERAPRRGCG